VIPVIILNWNGLDDTSRCLDHLLASEGVSFRAVVVDNGSDQRVDFEMLKARYGKDSRVELQANPTNLGFAAGMNKVLQSILDERQKSPKSHHPEYVALLNNDAFVEPDWLAALLARAQSSGAGAVASCMLRDDCPELLDNAGHIFLNTGEVLPRGSMSAVTHYQQQAEIAGACGGACLLRLDMLEEIGLFDLFYSTGYEDAELGLRAMLAGWRQVYEPSARVRHKIGASIDKIRDLKYAVTLQINIYYAYFKLMPLSVMVLNLPWMMIKTLGLLFVPLLTGRWRLAKVQWIATYRCVLEIPTFIKARRLHPKSALTCSEILKKQKFFARRYANYFIRFVWRGEPTIFER